MTATPQATKESPAPGRRLAILAICFAIAITEGYDLQAAAVGATQLRSDLSINAQLLGWIFSAGTFGLLIGAALGGRLSDRFGRKPVLLASVTIFGFVSVGASFVHSAEQLLACRVAVGIGMGGTLPTLIAISAEASPPEQRARSVAIVIAGLSVGGALVSLFGLLATNPGSWRTLFLIGGTAPLLLCAPVALFTFAPGAGATSRRAMTGIATALFSERGAEPRS